MLLKRNPAHTEEGTQRIEAFSDGVFAIAITLLILEIHVPRQGENATVPHLSSELGLLWPSYFGYFFSFVSVGIYWANHHYLFRMYKRTDHIFNMLNVLFLMCISFLPFPTAVLSEYFRDKANHDTAVSFYTLGLFLPALAWTLIWLYGSRGYRLIDEALEPHFVSYLTRQYLVSPLLYLFAFAASFWNATLALTVAGGVTLLYLLPPKRPYYREVEKPFI